MSSLVSSSKWFRKSLLLSTPSTSLNKIYLCPWIFAWAVPFSSDALPSHFHFFIPAQPSGSNVNITLFIHLYSEPDWKPLQDFEQSAM